MSEDGYLGSFCPECGPNVGVDEDGLCVSCGCTAVGSAVDKQIERIAELEAENARLRENMSELALESGHVQVMRERDEARAACVVKDEALKAYLDTCEAWGDVGRCACECCVPARAALSSTGAELLKEREQTRKNLEFTVSDRDRLHAQRDELRARLEEKQRELQSCTEREAGNFEEVKVLRARLETAERHAKHWEQGCWTEQKRAEKTEAERNQLREELRLEKRDSDDFALSADAQLEAMRAALESVTKQHDERCQSLKPNHPDLPGYACDCGRDEARAALSPSAPRLYRNQVLEEAAKHLDERGVREDSAYLHEASAMVRVLKDKESGA